VSIGRSRSLVLAKGLIPGWDRHEYFNKRAEPSVMSVMGQKRKSSE
jgi:hypothetical protein